VHDSPLHRGHRVEVVRPAAAEHLLADALRQLLEALLAAHAIAADVERDAHAVEALGLQHAQRQVLQGVERGAVAADEQPAVFLAGVQVTVEPVFFDVDVDLDLDPEQAEHRLEERADDGHCLGVALVGARGGGSCLGGVSHDLALS
jgi:hypothetical protein